MDCMIPCAIRNDLFLFLCALLIISPISAISLSPGNSFAGAPTIANGDPVYIHGIATGQPSAGLQVWLIGYNYVKIATVSTNADNTYEYELKSADTQSLAPGQYFVLVQHPMMNGVFDIYYDATTGSVFNRQLGSGTSIFQLTGSGSLQNTDGANALMRAINSQNLDDTFATTSFIIDNPTAFIKPIGDHPVGDKFTITGSTNLAVGNTLMIEITSSSFNPTTKVQSGEFSGSSGTVRVEPGTNGFNRWSFNVDASAFKPDEYIATVTGETIDVTASTTFNIVERLTTTVKTPLPEPTVQTTIPVTATSPLPSTTTQKSPLSMSIIVIACVLVGSAGIVKRE
jgi:trimeric autotransporter adhesin